MRRPTISNQNKLENFKDIVAAVAVGAALVVGCPTKAGITATDFSTSDGFIYTAGGSGSQIIPDNTPAGVGYAMNCAASGLSINTISVTLNLSGGYNGDIYAYLTHDSQMVTLLAPSPTLSGSDFSVTLVEGTGNPIPTTGGGTISGTSFTANQNLNVFNRTDPNGAWTLFFADQSPGDTSTLNGFNLEIKAVPEPVNLALAAFGVVLAAVGFVRWFLRAGLRGRHQFVAGNSPRCSCAIADTG